MHIGACKGGADGILRNYAPTPRKIAQSIFQDQSKHNCFRVVNLLVRHVGKIFRNVTFAIIVLIQKFFACELHNRKNKTASEFLKRVQTQGLVFGKNSKSALGHAPFRSSRSICCFGPTIL